MNRNFLLVAAVAALSFLADQASKWLILNVVMAPPQVISLTSFFNLRLGFNTGVSFGMFSYVLQDVPWVLSLFSVTVAGGLIVWAVRTDSTAECVGLAMMAGGALGNAMDRHRQGAVTDFLDFHYGGWHWPTFNMADVAIFCGVALLVAGGFYPARARSIAGDP